MLLEEQSDQCLHCLLVLMKYPEVWPFCLNFRKITAKFSGVRKFMNFTVTILLVLMKYPEVWPFCLNFRKITAKFFGLRKFMNFTVTILKYTKRNRNANNISTNLSCHCAVAKISFSSVFCLQTYHMTMNNN